jgi:peptidoglycan biosynthesis protein MviN/MurJ (putative lipid II flippase)
MLIALIPVMVMPTLFYGWRPLLLVLTGMLTAMICECVGCLLMRRRISVLDGYAAASGALIGALMSPLAPMWMPVAGAMFLLSEEIVGILYLRGSFTTELASAAAVSLRMLSLAMPAYAISEYFSRVCYSCARVRRPMAASAAGIATSLLTALFFLMTDGISVSAVALSVVLGQTASGVIMMVSCMDLMTVDGKREWVKYGFLLVGFFVSVAAMWLCRDYLRQNLHFFNAFQNFLIVTIVFSVGFMVYSIWWILLKNVRIFDLRSVAGNEDI